MKKTLSLPALLCVLTGLLVAACSGWNPTQSQKEDAAVQRTIYRFKRADSSIQTFFDKSYGYVIIPTVGKGGFIVGGGYGKGLVYEQGNFIGYASITNVTVGAQIGGQTFSEIIFFKDKAALEDFKRNNLEFAAQATAVILTEGVSKDRDFDRGVAVFTIPKAGAMAEATIGGQQFKFEPANPQ